MIKIPYKDVSDFNFQTALQKLAGATTDGHSAYKIKKVWVGVKKAREAIAEEYKKDIMPKYVKLDEKGEWTPETFQVDPAKEAEFIKAQDEFGAKVIEIDRPQLTMSDIRSVQLSALEQLALEPVLDDTQAEQGAMAIPQAIRQAK